MQNDKNQRRHNEPSQQERTPLKPHWSHHPLLVSAVSILLGGYGLYRVQLGTERNKAIMEKRLSLITEVVDYCEGASGVLRSIDQFTCQIEKAHLSKSDTTRREEDYNGLMTQIYRQESLLEIRLAIYFHDEATMKSFENLKNAFHESVNTGATHLQAAIPKGKCHENERQAELQKNINHLGTLARRLLDKMAAKTKL